MPWNFKEYLVPDTLWHLVLLVLHLTVLQEVGGVAEPLRVPVSKWSLVEGSFDKRAQWGKVSVLFGYQTNSLTLKLDKKPA